MSKIKSPIGNHLNCKGWHQEAAFRMLQNNLDPIVAEDPDNLIIIWATSMILCSSPFPRLTISPASWCEGVTAATLTMCSPG